MCFSVPTEKQTEFLHSIAREKCQGPNYPPTSVSSLSWNGETKEPCCSEKRNLAELSTTYPGLIRLMSTWSTADVVCGCKEDVWNTTSPQAF